MNNEYIWLYDHMAMDNESGKWINSEL